MTAKSSQNNDSQNKLDARMVNRPIAVVGMSALFPDAPNLNQYWNNKCHDCNGIEDGPALVDSCGICQQAYIYDFITHNVTLINDTNNITLGATEMIIMPNDPSNPYWNSGCGGQNNSIEGYVTYNNSLASPIENVNIYFLALLWRYIWLYLPNLWNRSKKYFLH